MLDFNIRQTAVTAYFSRHNFNFSLHVFKMYKHTNLLPYLQMFYSRHCSVLCRAEALVQWLKLTACKIGDRVFVSHSGIQVPKKQNVSSSLISKYSV